MFGDERDKKRLGTFVRMWRLQSILGRGGMATVFSATNRLGHRAAVKILHTELAHRQEIAERFVREAELMKGFDHPGVVPVLEVDRLPSGEPYFVMELLDGESYDEVQRKQGILSVEEVLSCADQLLDVLTAAHARGIVHRDIKPQNLFHTSTGDLRVLDFGVARILDGLASQTATGSVLGTPAFMPPEQAESLRERIGPHTDVWATGATMFTLLTARFVHEADNVNQHLIYAATRRARSVASLRPDLPGGLIDIIDRALAFEPERRWRTADEMRQRVNTLRAQLARPAFGAEDDDDETRAMGVRGLGQGPSKQPQIAGSPAPKPAEPPFGTMRMAPAEAALLAPPANNDPSTRKEQGAPRPMNVPVGPPTVVPALPRVLASPPIAPTVNDPQLGASEPPRAPAPQASVVLVEPPPFAKDPSQNVPTAPPAPWSGVADASDPTEDLSEPAPDSTQPVRGAASLHLTKAQAEMRFSEDSGTAPIQPRATAPRSPMISETALGRLPEVPPPRDSQRGQMPPGSSADPRGSSPAGVPLVSAPAPQVAPSPPTPLPISSGDRTSHIGDPRASFPSGTPLVAPYDPRASSPVGVPLVPPQDPRASSPVGVPLVPPEASSISAQSISHAITRRALPRAKLGPMELAALSAGGAVFLLVVGWAIWRAASGGTPSDTASAPLSGPTSSPHVNAFLPTSAAPVMPTAEPTSAAPESPPAATASASASASAGPKVPSQRGPRDPGSERKYRPKAL